MKYEYLIHKMHLYPEPFEKILSGEKQIEYRLYDKKRQQITLGDIIEFTNTDDPIQKIRVKVSGYLYYPTFRALFEQLMPAQGGPEPDHLDEWVDAMYETYSKEDEEKFGAVGIMIKRVESSE